MAKVALITGASSGFGNLTVKEFLKKGFIVYAGARRLEKMQELEVLGAKIYKMDVTVDEDIEKVVADIIKNEGQIDVLVNNAGYGGNGVIEAVLDEEAKKQFEVNVFALMKVTRAVLPYMRKRKSGVIINLSSIVGKLAMPMMAWYSASKHAVEALSDALRIEVETFGIKVVVVEPGVMATDFLEVSLKSSASLKYPPEYQENVTNFLEAFKEQYKKASAPEETIKAIITAATSQKPKTRYVTGKGNALNLLLVKILPDKIVDFVLKKMFKLK